MTSRIAQALLGMPQGGFHLAKGSTALSGPNVMPWHRMQQESDQNLHLNNKFFQPPLVPRNATPEENWRWHKMIRDRLNDGYTPDEIREEIYRTRPAR